MRTALLTATLLAGATGAYAATPADHAAWSTAIARTHPVGDGCFAAHYPSAAWTAVPCKVAPNRPYPPHVRGGVGLTTGDGNDYVASTATLTSQAVGSFTAVKHLTSENDEGESNTYSLQANSQFFASPTCKGAANPSKCLGWEQFVYSNSGIAFMQYWLINYNNTCPSGGWMSFEGDCYRNSQAVGVPVQPLNELKALNVTGTATKGASDILTVGTADSAYSTSGKDSVVDLAAYWKQTEYNVIGDGGGSEAVFNKGASITVKIAVTDGTKKAPTCVGNAGTTAETNNLTLGACKTQGGAPAVIFTESD